MREIVSLKPGGAILRRVFCQTLVAVLFAIVMISVTASEANRPRTQAFYGINADPVWDFKGYSARSNQLSEFSGMLRQTRAGSIRVPIRWRVVEPSQGKWDFSAVDRSLAAIPKDIEILGCILSVPAWANGTTPGKVEGWFDCYPPKDISDWEKAVGRIVSHYKKRIRYWEIWNEQNGVDFYRPHPDAKAYTELLKAAWRSAKKSDKKCKIVLGGLQFNGIMANPWSPVKVENFLEDLYKAGAGPYFDICNTHPYVLPEEGSERMMAMTRETFAIMAKYGDGKKPLWITEVGCGATTPEAREAQAKLLRETYALASLELRIERLFWFLLRDMQKDLVGPEASMGLFDFQGQPKPALKAYVDSAR